MKVDAASSLYGLYLVAASPLATADQSVILRVRRHSKRVGSVLFFLRLCAVVWHLVSSYRECVEHVDTGSGFLEPWSRLVVCSSNGAS